MLKLCCFSNIPLHSQAKVSQPKVHSQSLLHLLSLRVGQLADFIMNMRIIESTQIKLFHDFIFPNVIDITLRFIQNNVKVRASLQNNITDLKIAQVNMSVIAARGWFQKKIAFAGR